MKKITAIALVSISLIACKKDTKTVTKTDPKTGKTITVDVPADSASTVAAPVVQPAIKDSLGVYKQSFKLQKGQTYPLTTYTRNMQTVTDPSGKSASGTSENTDEMSFKVEDFQNGIYDITINLIAKRNSQSMNGKTMVVDTRTVAPADQNMKMMWSVNKALVGNTLKMKMKENGEVVSITGFEPIYNKVSTAVGTIIKDAKEKNAFIKSFKESFGEKSVKEQFTKNLNILPAKGVKIGESWTETENASPDGKVKLVTTATLKSVGDGVATISVKGGIPYKANKKTQQGVTHSISSELSQNGTITLDQNTGWLKNQNVNVKTTQTESLSDGKQTQSMKSVSNSTVIVNPAKK